MNVNGARRFVSSELERRKDNKRAEGAKKYLKSPWRFYGVKTPVMRKIARSVLKKYPEMTKEELTKLVTKLWESEWHEEKSIAIMLLHSHEKLLTIDDLSAVEWMVDTATGWDHLDEIALRVMGPMVERDNNVWNKVIGWMESENFWKRRSVILCQIPQFRKGRGDLKTFARLTESQFDERDDWDKEERFFIRKAIGWALRELCKAKPDWVVEFVNNNRDKMSGLTYREATRRLGEENKGNLK
jgi:3-methyladenine DNA glycosylase AlkD